MISFHFNTPRMIYLVACILCGLALAISIFFMQQFLQLEPCPLCLLSRLIVATLAVLFLLVVLHNPRPLGYRIYSGLSFVLIAAGIAVSARHIYLQNLPPEAVPGCTPDMGYLFDNFPLLEAAAVIFNSTGECANIVWTFLGLTIPQQTLVFFIVLLLAMVAALVKAPRRIE